MRRLRNKLNYKQSEYAALSKLGELKQEPKNLGRLKRLKGDIEFKIATEAHSLGAEKELIKKLSTINAELEDALRIFRFKRKVILVSRDIEELGKAFENSRAQIAEIDKKLDEFYANLREVTGWRKKEDRRPRQQHAKPQDHFEVSLEDIATIKNKKEDKEKADSD